MAKRFFYVCAGLFLLAGAYALGARNAVAQSGAILGSYQPDTSPAMVDGSGNLWILEKTTGEVYGPYALPGSGPIADFTAAYTPGSFHATVLYENGDAYRHDAFSSWMYHGNVLGGATPAAGESFGSLKVRYR